MAQTPAVVKERSEIQRKMLKSSLNQALIGLMLSSSALAASPAEQRGKTLALNNCARCHSIDRASRSPLKIAPPFRTLHDRYPVENLAESLAEGIETGHQNMPVFRLDADQIHDLLAYLKTLE
jgi:mono/diheme cytochrome c family protein